MRGALPVPRQRGKRSSLPSRRQRRPATRGPGSATVSCAHRPLTGQHCLLRPTREAGCCLLAGTPTWGTLLWQANTTSSSSRLRRA